MGSQSEGNQCDLPVHTQQFGFAWATLISYLLCLYRPCCVRHCRKQGLKRRGRQTTTDFLVLYIVFIDHVMYVLRENKA
jgi:hypothetical protein